MKLGKTSWLVLTSGILIIAFGSLGIAHFRQDEEQNQLDEELYVVARRLNKVQFKQLSYQREELAKQLNQTLSQAAAAKDELRQSIESIEVIDSLFEIAEACGVEISGISSSGVVSDELEGIIYSVIRPVITAEGDAPNLISFIIKLNNDFTTGVVESAEINIPEATGEDKPSANIRLVVYSYQGE